MFTISQETVKVYADEVDALARASGIGAGNAVQAICRAVADKNGVIHESDIALVRNAAIDVLLSTQHPIAEQAAQLSADMYTAVRAHAMRNSRYAAIVDSGQNPEATVGAVKALIQSIVDTGESARFVREIRERADAEVRKAAKWCTDANVRRDPARPKYALVPSGASTCDFCRMLASRGAVYANNNPGKNGVVNHAHRGCKCTLVPVFEGTRIAGHNPADYMDDYMSLLQGHELEQYLDLAKTQSGRNSSRMYMTRAYDYDSAIKIGARS